MPWASTREAPKPIVVVTGAFGFLGLHVCRSFAGSEVEVVPFDRMTYAAVNEDAVRALDAVRFTVDADVADRESWGLLEGSLVGRKVAAVVHLAAETHVDRSLGRVPTTLAAESLGRNDVDALERFWRSNAIGTARVARWCSANGVRMVHVSTDEVLGDRWTGPTIDGGGRISGGEVDVAHPSSPPHPPGSPYAASKVAAEAGVLAEVRSFGLDAVIVRPTNLYGPGQAIDKLLPVAVRKLCSNELVPLYGDGKQIREWVHVEDVARLLVHLTLEATDVSLLPSSSKCGVVHAGSGRRASNRHVVNMLADRAEERGLRHPGTDRTTCVEDRPGHDFAYGLDSTQTTLDTLWRPMRSLLHERDLDELLDTYGVAR